jgi:transposase
MSILDQIPSIRKCGIWLGVSVLLRLRVERQAFSTPNAGVSLARM